MGLFDNIPGPAAAVLPPLSHDRIAKVLETKGAHFGRDDNDGHPYGMWDGHPFRFHARGEKEEILMIRAFWRPEPPASLFNEFLLACNEWSSTRLFPKVYAEEREGKLWLICELSCDLEYGVTDEQLEQLVSCAISTSGQFFEFLEEKFPQHAQWDTN